MFFSKVNKKTKRFNRKIETVKVGDPMPEATTFRHPEMFAMWLDDDSTQCKNYISTWEARTGRKIEELLSEDDLALKGLESAAEESGSESPKPALDFSENEEFNVFSIDDILEELNRIKGSDQPDLTFDPASSKEVLFDVLLKARTVGV